MIKVIGVAASPRRGGNSETLLDAFLEGARSSGAGVEKVRLDSLRLVPCRACGGCHDLGACVNDDDTGRLVQRLRAAEIAVLASPIHFYGLSAQAHILISRAQCCWASKYLLKRSQGKSGSGVLIAVGATRGANLFNGAKLIAHYFFDALDKQLEESILVPGAEEMGAVRKEPGAIERAADAGRRMALSMAGAEPAPDPPSSDSEQRISLDRWLDAAVLRERHLRALFELMAAGADDARNREVFTELSAVEVENLRRIEAARPGPDQPEAVLRRAPKPLERLVGQDPPEINDRVSAKQALMYCLRDAAEARELYIWLSEALENPELGTLFSALAEAKARHQQVLEEILVRRFIRS